MTSGKRSRRNAAASRETRRRATQAGRRSRAALAIGAVVVIVVGMAAVAALREPGKTKGSSDAGAAATVVQSVPGDVLRAVGAGSGVTPPAALPAGTATFKVDGKPAILYVGAEYCPYCAAQRWPLIVALSRFGRFSGLGATESAAGDIFPRTPTFTFHGATYTSDLVSFTGVETSTNQRTADGSGYEPLDSPTAGQGALLAAFDRAPYTSRPGAIPFLLMGNRYVVIGASYRPDAIQNMTIDEIAAALSEPSSPVATQVDGSANMLTAAICELTSGRPEAVCTDPAIAAIRPSLPRPS